jgi:hypothetical protein
MSSLYQESFNTGTITTTMMKYQVIYIKNKFKQVATFYNIEDAIFWEDYIKKEGCEKSEIIPLF